MRGLALLPLMLSVGCVASKPPLSAPPVVVANDNRTPSGTLHDGILTLSLDVVIARWYPEAASGPYVDVPAFTESGEAPTIPAPLIRVPAVTRVRLVIHNRLATNPIGLWGPGITTTNDSTTVALASGTQSG